MKVVYNGTTTWDLQLGNTIPRTLMVGDTINLIEYNKYYTIQFPGIYIIQKLNSEEIILIRVSN